MQNNLKANCCKKKGGVGGVGKTRKLNHVFLELLQKGKAEINHLGRSIYRFKTT